MSTSENVHAHEIEKFSALADRWWDADGDFRTLHAVNPLRVRFILKHAQIDGKKVLDVGCGGGILSEALAQNGADVLGIDMSEELIEIADLHSLESGVDVNYRQISAEALAEEQAAEFDHITCMEMLEHVPDPASIVTACARLVKPGGKLFFSTLNRTSRAYMLAIIGAEYLLNLIPKGTHDFKTFIRPSELSGWARNADLELREIVGIEYNPISRKFKLGDDLNVNYIVVFQRPIN